MTRPTTDTMARCDAHGRADATAGFTLVEVLVALSISALLLSAAVQALDVLSRVAGRGARDIDRIDMVTRGAAAVRNDLGRIEHAIAIGRKGSRSSSRYIFSGDREALSFLAIEPPFPAAPGSYLISYEVRHHAAGNELVRSRRLFDPGPSDRGRSAGSAQSADPAEVAVLEGPYEFGFSYLLRSGANERWVERWTDPRRLPVLIRLEAASTNPATPSLASIIVRPRIDAEIACLFAQTPLCGPRQGGAIGDVVGENQATGQATGPASAPGAKP